jgi:adenine phosphoribosyltransferase
MSLEEQINQTIRTVPDFPKPGIQFKDISPLFENQNLCSNIAQAFIDKMGPKPDAIIGIESRGFLFGFLIANKLNVPFIMVRKAGKLPAKTIRYQYDLEYGSATIEIHEDALKKDWNVMIHDDLLATGGTAEAAAHLVKQSGANVCGFTFVVELGFLNGKEKLLTHSNNITCLVQY